MGRGYSGGGRVGGMVAFMGGSHDYDDGQNYYYDQENGDTFQDDYDYTGRKDNKDYRDSFSNDYSDWDRRQDRYDPNSRY